MKIPKQATKVGIPSFSKLFGVSLTISSWQLILQEELTKGWTTRRRLKDPRPSPRVTRNFSTLFHRDKSPRLPPGFLSFFSFFVSLSLSLFSTLAAAFRIIPGEAAGTLASVVCENIVKDGKLPPRIPSPRNNSLRNIFLPRREPRAAARRNKASTVYS